MIINIFNLLQECKVESDVEEKYKRIISKYFPTAKISSPYYTDGFLQNGVTMLMEFKYNFNLTKRLPLVELLIQMLYYLKQFEAHGDDIPRLLFGGDINECFCIHSNDLIKYLNEDLDWSIGASSAPDNNPELAKKIYNDQNIKPYIFSINNDHFDFKFVIDKIKQLNEGIIQKVRITELNINRFFSYFRDIIIKQKKQYSAEDLVAIFLNCLVDPTNSYVHPKKKNCLVTSAVGEISINRNLYDSFFEHFESTYSIEEKKHLTSICDRLIEDESRRFHGEFYTPTEWVNEAHKMIEEQFGPNWKEKYVVWDPAWGTGNLTRDYKFKELYCSTLNYGDLNVGQCYNPEAVKFQYDFLSDDVTPDGLLPFDRIKLPEGLLQAFKQDNPIIIFMNPPYLTFTGDWIKKKTNKKSKIYNVMPKYGQAKIQLYTQFIYRIMKIIEQYKLTKLNIVLFHPTIFLSGSSYKKFRNHFLKLFKFKYGMIFNASNFSSVSSEWAISFTIFEVGGKFDTQFNCDIKDSNLKGIEKIGSKIIINADLEKKLNMQWMTEDIKDIKKIDFPKLSNPINVKEYGEGSFCENAIGFLVAGNSARYNKTVVNILSASFVVGGFSVIKENFMKSVASFTSRKPIKTSWINDKDEYFIPNESHPEYEQWNLDAIIYALFNGSSNQSSLRKITYKEKIWDIKNEWFWMSNKQMMNLANEHDFDALYHDSNGDSDRFVFDKIQESTFSKDAIDVLNKAIELVIKTFPYREQLHEEYPEWHLNTWDAGWYQIKLILKKYFKDDLKEFNILYKTFEDRMREGVYKFEFLK